MKFVFEFTKPEDGTAVKFEGGRTALWAAQEESASWPERPTQQPPRLRMGILRGQARGDAQRAGR